MPSVTRREEKKEFVTAASAMTTTRNKTNNEIKQNKFYWKFNYVAHKLMKLVEEMNKRNQANINVHKNFKWKTHTQK